MDCAFVFFVYGGFTYIFSNNNFRFLGICQTIFITICNFIIFFISYGYKNELHWNYVVFYASAHIIFIIKTYFTNKNDHRTVKSNLNNIITLNQIIWFKASNFP